MARVLLLSPPSVHRSPAPPPSLGSLAAALLREGHGVRILDLAATHGPGESELVDTLQRWEPDLVGVSLYTEGALAAYDLVSRLPRGRARWVAGGPHATAVPQEPLQHGFDRVLPGEAEGALVDLAEGRVPRQGERVHELDLLPSPVEAAHLFEPSWYSPTGHLAQGLVTSRGCPGRCTFCASQHGRRVRAHGVDRVISDLLSLGHRHGLWSFSFHDDAFTTLKPRLLSLCEAMRERLPPSLSWWCEGRVDALDAQRAEAMAGAGCKLVVLGVESGDDAVLQAVGKGIRVAQVRQAFAVARQAGLRTVANLMVGFPQEDEAALGRTLELAQTLDADHLSALGVLVPFPGTNLYEEHHQRCGFTAWWLDRGRMASLQQPLHHPLPDWPSQRIALEQALLDADFFGYSPDLRAAMEEVLVYKRLHG